MIETLIDDYVATRLAYDEAKAASSQADKVHKVAKAKLVAEMEANDYKGINKVYGLTFDIRSPFSIKCNDDNEEDMKAWLLERYGDIEEFSDYKLRKKSVRSRIQEDIDGELLDEFDVPDFVGLKTNPDVWCTGWKEYSKEHRA